MLTNNRAFIVVFLAIFAFVMYRVGSGSPDIIENFWNLSGASFTVRNDRYASDARNQCGSAPRRVSNIKNNNNCQNTFYDANPLISAGLLSDRQTDTLRDSLSAPNSASYKQYQSQLSGGPNVHWDQKYSDLKERSVNIPPTYTVPGTYQSYLSPRFNAEGYNSFVKYNLPSEEHLGTRANDPLMMADMVEKHHVKEGFESNKKTFVGDSPAQYQSIYDQQKKQGNDVAAQLPVPTMGSAAAAASGKPDNNFFVNYDRPIYALLKSQLYASQDYIRGALPIIPDCKQWFQVSVNPKRDLNTGAAFVMNGLTNETAQQTATVAMSSVQGLGQSVAGGVAVNPPEGTTARAIMNAQQAQVDSLNMGNQINILADNRGGLNTVKTTMFP